MKKVEIILFDVDGTLLDFDKTEDEALANTFNELGIEKSHENFEAYRQVNTSLWVKLEQGKIDKDRLKTERFRLFFENKNIQVDESLASDTYLKHLSNSYFIIDNAVDICRKLKENYRLAIVTNGISAVQRSRVKLSGLDEVFEHIFISDDIGYAKPRIEFFDYVFDVMKIGKPGKVLIIGDSLSSDIKGGNNSGIKTCWYNPAGLANSSDSVCDYEIKSLYEIEEIVT